MTPNLTRSSVKCIPFKLSRIRYVSEPECQSQEFVVTGSWMEEVNRVCLWRYHCDELIDSGKFKPTSENENDISPGVLGDSADDPRLVDSLVHPGWVQDMKVHRPSRRMFSVSSRGTLLAYQANFDSMRLSRLTEEWAPFRPIAMPSNQPIALASLSLSHDGTQVDLADDLGRIAIVAVNRLPNQASIPKSEYLPTPIKPDTSAIVQTGADITSVNALERVDASTLASVNQLGQLKVWDLRCGLAQPQQRILRPSEAQPLHCLSRHPGQSHLLAVGGVEGSGSAAYIWDIRAEQYPLSEVACAGRSVFEVGFHPRQPKHLYLATEAAGMLQISCRGDTDSWTGFKGSRRKLSVAPVLPGGTSIQDVISFDMTNTQLVCGHSDAIIQTVECDTSVY